MKLKQSALLYDISNLAYIIADTHEENNFSIHRIRDICEDGNIDRVARILGLAYSNIVNLLKPVLTGDSLALNHDTSRKVRDYEFRFSTSRQFSISPETKITIKETIREYMVTFVLADWLAVTFPEIADVWKYKAEAAYTRLTDILQSIVSTLSGTFKRRLSPF